MNDAQAAQVLLPAVMDEARYRKPCLVTVHAMQIEPGLDHPAATSQIAQHTARQAGSQPGRLVAAFKLEIEQIRARQGFGEHGGGVVLRMSRNGGRGRRLVMHAIPCQGPNICHRFLEGNALILGGVRPPGHGLQPAGSRLSR